MKKNHYKIRVAQILVFTKDVEVFATNDDEAERKIKALKFDLATDPTARRHRETQFKYLEVNHKPVTGASSISVDYDDIIQINTIQAPQTLSEINKMLLGMGAKQAGSFVEGYHYIQERLKVDEAEDIYRFCQYIDNEIGGAGPANYDILYKAFKNPDNQEAQKAANEVRDQINSIKNRIKYDS